MKTITTNMLSRLAAVMLGLSLAAPAAADPYWPPVQELFARHCTLCHSGPAASLGLNLDRREAVLAGSSKGPVVVAGKPGDSELVRRLRGQSLPRMPLTGPPYLDENAISLVETWIASLDPAGAVIPAKSPAPESAVADPAPLDQTVARDPSAAAVALLVQRCAVCHSPQGKMGPAPEGFIATSYANLLDARERAWIVPGRPLASEVLRRIQGLSLPRMPFDGPPYLNDTEISVIEDWIAAGAPNSEGLNASLPIGARVRLGGTLTGQWLLDGLPLHVDTQSRIRETFRPGQRVQVRGWVDSAGNIRVDRIRAR